MSSLKRKQLLLLNKTIPENSWIEDFTHETVQVKTYSIASYYIDNLLFS